MSFRLFTKVALFAALLVSGAVADTSQSKYNAAKYLISSIQDAMLGSIRTSWEQGTAATSLVDLLYPQYSPFSKNPFAFSSSFPQLPLQFAVSAVQRQTSDGRLSQNINDALDGAALDGASAGTVVLLGTIADPTRGDFWSSGAQKELNWLTNGVPRTSTGALSMRADSLAYWSDGVFMAPPFLAASGVQQGNSSLVQLAYDTCRLYRNALILPVPTTSNTTDAYLWGHIVSDTGQWSDEGLWATGNGWAAQGMLRVLSFIIHSPFASEFHAQSVNLTLWVKEILSNTFPYLTSSSLVPNYIVGGNPNSQSADATYLQNVGDASSSAAIAAAAFRLATLSRQGVLPVALTAQEIQSYTDGAEAIMGALVAGLKANNLALMNPVVDPLSWSAIGTVSTEGQGFGLMAFSAWRDWIPYA